MGADLARDLAQNLAPSSSAAAWQTLAPAVAGWWRKGSGESLNSGALDVWTDAINGYELTSVGGSRPTDDASGWRFTAANSQMMRHTGGLATAVRGAQAYTMLIAYKAVTTGAFQLIAGWFDDTDNNHWHLLRHDDSDTLGYYRRYTGGTLSSVGASTINTAKHVLGGQYSGTAGRPWFDGVAEGSAVTMSAAPVVDRFSIGGFDRATSPLQYADGVYHQILVGLQAWTPEQILEYSTLMQAEMP